ncbi:DNA primase [Candidatus Peregrinibacteria bacterium]|nr:MAG: DNA primase [Candidatus Peregrinibacteria bacterium]
MDYIEEIRAKMPIEDLVSQYVQLKRAGRNFKGLSPFKEEKTPSFIVSPDKGIAYCFATQQGGDVFQFIQLMEKVDFRESVKILAEKTSINLPESFFKTGSNQQTPIYKDIMSEAVLFYEETFAHETDGKKYWEQRDIDTKITKKFHVGFSPMKEDALSIHLQKKNFSSQDIIEVGLALRQDTGGKVVDRFRNRLMIPIFDHMGRPIAFGGRIIHTEDQRAKYINSPENPLYHKSRVLFGIDKAKDMIRKNDKVFILEGYMDVIAAHQMGLENVVAVSGTALTEDQLKLLARYTKHIVLCFDQDTAGRRATTRSIEIAARQGFFIEILLFDEAKDLDELMKNGQEKWDKALKNTCEPVDFYFLEAEERFSLDNSKQKQLFVKELLEVFSLFADVSLQQQALQKLSEKTAIPLTLLYEEIAKYKERKPFRREKHVPIIKQKNIVDSKEKYLLGFVSSQFSFFPEMKKNLIFSVFSDSHTKDIYKVLLETYNGQASIDDFEGLKEDDKKLLHIYQIYVEDLLEDLTESEKQKNGVSIISRMNKENIQKKEQMIIQKLQSGITEDDQKKLLAQMIEINKLKKLL